MTPLRLFSRLAIAEAITWALLLVGMFLKYVTKTTDLGVTVFGLVHGAVFIAYVLGAVVVWVNQRWSAGTGLLALVSAVPPFVTIIFERWAERRSLLTGDWRLGPGREPARTLPERAVSWAVGNPRTALLAGAGAVVLVTAALLVIGPPPAPGTRGPLGD